MKLELDENNRKIFDVSLVLSKALELIFEENKGLIVDTPQDTKTFNDSTKLVVYKKDNSIQITSINTDVQEGSYIEVKI